MGDPSAAAGQAPVANKIVSWLVLLFGLLEVPWVIYLAFTQEKTVEANHLRLAALGIRLAGGVLCAWAAYALWRRRPARQGAGGGRGHLDALPWNLDDPVAGAVGQ